MTADGQLRATPADNLPAQRPRLATTWAFPVLAFAVSVVFFVFSTRPLWHTDLWGHLAYGRWIWEARAVPTTEPLMPLAAGSRFVDLAWLTQLIGFGIVTALDVYGLQLLYALSVAACVALVLWQSYRSTQNAVCALIAGAAYLWIEWQQLEIIRPQLAGMLCFGMLFCWMTANVPRRSDWLFIPTLFALWANLHGSFPIGLATLGTATLGRAIDILRGREVGTSPTLKAIKPISPIGRLLRDRGVRRLLGLTLAASAAVLINPYGAKLYAEVLSVARHQNVSDIVEWAPLTWHMDQGKAALSVAAAVLVLRIVSGRRFTSAEFLLFAGFGCAMFWASRMIVWWAPVAAYLLAVNCHATWRRYLASRFSQFHVAPHIVWTAVGICITVIALGASPPVRRLVFGGVQKKHSALSSQTPIDAASFLREHPPAGQVFNTYEWGDYLLWAGPRGVRVFVASHVHLIPNAVWRDYLHLIRVDRGWKRLLNRYDVQTIIIDRDAQVLLAERLRTDADWHTIYEDDVAVIFERSHN